MQDIARSVFGGCVRRPQAFLRDRYPLLQNSPLLRSHFVFGLLDDEYVTHSKRSVAALVITRQ